VSNSFSYDAESKPPFYMEREGELRSVWSQSQETCPMRDAHDPSRKRSEQLGQSRPE